uniref:Uncharacterized protein n=1 Tax=Timema poppense TaxID=170557 RepID=A0A7R9HB72_TIMPO|nr:unnamed protein product [Timema poppensis]
MTYSSPMASLVLDDSSQLTADGFEKLSDQIILSEYYNGASQANYAIGPGGKSRIPILESDFEELVLSTNKRSQYVPVMTSISNFQDFTPGTQWHLAQEAFMQQMMWMPSKFPIKKNVIMKSKLYLTPKKRTILRSILPEPIATSTEDIEFAHQSRSGSDEGSMTELAGYFDNLVHIPKKMSPMAEGMYR